MACQWSRTPAPARTASRSFANPMAARTSSATSGELHPGAEIPRPASGAAPGGRAGPRASLRRRRSWRRSAAAFAPRRAPGRRPSGGPGLPRAWRTSRRARRSPDAPGPRARARGHRARRQPWRFEPLPDSPARRDRAGAAPCSVFSFAFSAFFSRSSFHETTQVGGRLGERRRRGRPDQHQAEAVLAGKLAARAGAGERRAGQVTLGLIRTRAAPLALAPDQALARPEARPLPRRGQPLPRLGRRRVGGQRQDRLGGPGIRHHSRPGDGEPGVTARAYSDGSTRSTRCHYQGFSMALPIEPGRPRSRISATYGRARRPLPNASGLCRPVTPVSLIWYCFSESTSPPFAWLAPFMANRATRTRGTTGRWTCRPPDLESFKATSNGIGMSFFFKTGPRKSD